MIFLDVISYDPISDEFTKQNGIPLILRCINETKFKPLQAQQPALEILLALTFNQEAYKQLKQNLNQIKSLSYSPHQGVIRVVDSLLWRLEKQEENLLKSKTSPQTYQYDLMISYSHLNKDLIYQISDQLLKDNYRLWIDRDETTMSTKATIMDQSQYILICISDEYKQNPYCRSEAYYAYQSQYKIIPLILTSNFHPDGWLIDITNGKIYIDFIRLDFDLAYSTLKSEINHEDFYSITDPLALPTAELPALPTVESLAFPTTESVSYTSTFSPAPPSISYLPKM